jgi:hypothetical protein
MAMALNIIATRVFRFARRRAGCGQEAHFGKNGKRTCLLEQIMHKCVRDSAEP